MSVKNQRFFRCASISWFQVVSKWLRDVFTASASMGLSDLFTFFWDFKAHETYHLSGDHWVGPRSVGNADWGGEEVDDPSRRRLWCSRVPSLGDSSKWHSWVHPRGVEDWVKFKLLVEAIFRKSPQWHDASFGEISIKGLTPIQKFIGLHLIVDTGVSTSNRRPTLIKFWQSPF